MSPSPEQPPSVVILAGPNGAGKSTASRRLLQDAGIQEFVNADDIARDLCPADPESAAFAAGRQRLLSRRDHGLA
jgi:predicted ABC-type ATPase